MQKLGMALKNIHHHHNQLHFVMFPLMAPGHMIPMIDMAKLIAKHGVAVTIVTTPVNATRFKSTINRAIESGLNIRLSQLEFPWQEAGLPEGCENVDMLPSLGYAINFIKAAAKLQEPMEKLLKELQPKPSCLISDYGFTWTTEVARKFNIPRIVFNGMSCCSLLSLHNLIAYNAIENVKSDTEPIQVPGLPDRIELTRTQVPNAVHQAGDPLRVEMREAERTAFGVVVNSFEELESEYLKRCKEAKGKNTIWCVGPVSLCNQDELDKGERGNKAALTVEKCMKWLDLHKPRSVIYACLGSLCNVVASQVMQLAFGLEASNKPFILAMREGYNLKEVERLIEEDGFRKRVEGRGLVILGWAPQVLILSHPSVGGFLTHCGWNSTLEGISTGLPMVTCPLFSEQFLNEKFVVEVLRVGASARVENPTMNPGEEVRGISLDKEHVKHAIDLVMDDGKEGKEMRERAARLAESAKKAVEKGGSSERSLTLMIQDVIQEIEKDREEVDKRVI
ncbi:UDP-glycosyltransferase 73C3-like [Chenopodium quinoa]|uniref:UDP-glycosyltransferase 73C3-like n=1 Tax=Chenopodium quinoa TaxID=63459 RepID=UPI000B778772|nr:UDP-glycosyltransferase 73C3-like [Chenopodium quinoa]